MTEAATGPETGTPTGGDLQELLDGVVQLHYNNEQGTLKDLSAFELSEVLQGLVEFTSQMSKAGLFGSVPPPEVRIRPPKSGSFTVEAVLQFAQDNPEVANSMYTTAGAAVGYAVNVATRLLRNPTPEDFEYLDNGNVKVNWSDSSVSEVPTPVWKELQKQKKTTKRSLRKLMSPLGDDVNSLEVRGAGTEETTEEVLEAAPVVVLDRDDYRTAVRVDPDPEDEVLTYTIEATLLSVDFRPGEKWRIETRDGSRRSSRLATMEDDAFLLALDRGQALHKGDILNLRIRDVTSVKNGRSSREWTILQVLSQRRGVGDGGDDGEGTSEQPEG